jgi:hypothetical protein
MPVGSVAILFKPSLTTLVKANKCQVYGDGGQVCHLGINDATLFYH